MKIIINSNSQVDLNEDKIEYFRGDIESSLERFADWVTRIEVHLTDENSAKKGGDDDIRCLMEARPASHQPISIETRAGSPEQSIQEATDMLERRLDAMMDKIRSEQRKRQ